MCDLARDMNPAMRVVEKRKFSLMHLVTGALGKQPEKRNGSRIPC